MAAVTLSNIMQPPTIALGLNINTVQLGKSSDGMPTATASGLAYQCAHHPHPLVSLPLDRRATGIDMGDGPFPTVAQQGDALRQFVELMTAPATNARIVSAATQPMPMGNGPPPAIPIERLMVPAGKPTSVALNEMRSRVIHPSESGSRSGPATSILQLDPIFSMVPRSEETLFGPDPVPLIQEQGHAQDEEVPSPSPAPQPAPAVEVEVEVAPKTNSKPTARVIPPPKSKSTPKPTARRAPAKSKTAPEGIKEPEPEDEDEAESSVSSASLASASTIDHQFDMGRDDDSDSDNRPLIVDSGERDVLEGRVDSCHPFQYDEDCADQDAMSDDSSSYSPASGGSDEDEDEDDHDDQDADASNDLVASGKDDDDDDDDEYSDDSESAELLSESDIASDAETLCSEDSSSSEEDDDDDDDCSSLIDDTTAKDDDDDDDSDSSGSNSSVSLPRRTGVSRELAVLAQKKRKAKATAKGRGTKRVIIKESPLSKQARLAPIANYDAEADLDLSIKLPLANPKPTAPPPPAIDEDAEAALLMSWREKSLEQLLSEAKVSIAAASTGALVPALLSRQDAIYNAIVVYADPAHPLGLGLKPNHLVVALELLDSHTPSLSDEQQMAVDSHVHHVANCSDERAQQCRQFAYDTALSLVDTDTEARVRQLISEFLKTF